MRDLPVELPKERQGNQIAKPHSFVASHEPEENNYAHSEIQVMKDGQKVTKTSQVAETVKKEFRQIMSDRSIILRAPEV